MPRNSKRKIPGVPERRTIFATPELQDAVLSVIGRKIRGNKVVREVASRAKPFVERVKPNDPSRKPSTTISRSEHARATARKTARKVVELFSNPKVKISSNNPMTKATRQAVNKVSNLLKESGVTRQNLVSHAIEAVQDVPSIVNRKINRAARKLVNRSEQAGYLSPKQAAQWRFAIETHARKDRQIWRSPMTDRDYIVSPNAALSEELLKPSDIRRYYREKTVQRLSEGAKSRPQIINEIGHQFVQGNDIDEVLANILQAQREDRKQSQTRIVRSSTNRLRGAKKTDDEGNESYDYKALEGNLNELIGAYGKHRQNVWNLGKGGLITGLGAIGLKSGLADGAVNLANNIYSSFGKRQTPQTGKYAMKKMMGGKTGRMGKELTGVDGEKGRYFQKSRTAKRMTQKFYEVDKPHAPQMRAMQQGVSKRAKVREKITEFASPYGSPVQVQGYSVSRSYTTKRRVTKGTSRNARKIHEINDYNYYGDEKMRRPNTFRKNALGNSMNIGGGMNNFMSGNQMMPRRNMVQPPMPRVKTPSPMGLRSMNPMRPMGSTRFTAYPTARSMATGMPPTMRGGFGKRGR